MLQKKYSNKPPQSLCILRLSALGDITHTLPIFHTIRQAWPNTKISWIIGKAEYELIKHLQDIEFIVFDKKAGFSAYRDVRNKLKNKKFDILLHMQMSLRASLISLLVKSKVKIGFDKKRAKDGQWLFTNKKIQHKENQHVIDSFFCFTESIGIQGKKYDWDIPLLAKNVQSSKELLNIDSKYIIISPCSSKAYRNWNAQGYAAIADYINEKYNFSVVLTGGNSTIEQQYATEISQLSSCPIHNLIGKTTVQELLSIINEAEFMVSPDSGPAHMATAMNTPVIGLYAATNPNRARPYLSSKWVVNRYPDAIQNKYNKTVNEVPWGTRVRDAETMGLITINDVLEKIDIFFAEKTN